MRLFILKIEGVGMRNVGFNTMSTTQTMKNVGFTVPPAMADEIEQMAKKEHRTKSEFFRRMFTLYRTYKNVSAT